MNQEKRAYYCQCRNKCNSQHKRQKQSWLSAIYLRNYIETMNKCLDVPYGEVLQHGSLTIYPK